MPTVDVRYAGVVLARGAELSDANREGAFLLSPEPMPVGTSLEVVIDGAAVPAKVARVVEGGERPGMELQFRTVAVTAAAGLPAVAQPEPAAPAAEASATGSDAVPTATEPAPSGGNESGGGKGRRGRRRRS